jgi:tetratricopeptide (TPR) repeat protein
MNELASETRSNPAATARWTEQALQLARRFGYRRGEADALLEAAFAAMNRGSYGTAFQLYVRARHMYASAYSLTGLARTYRGLSWLAEFENRHTLALHHAQRSLRLSSNMRYAEGIANSLLRLGRCHLRSGRTGDADDAFRRCVTLSQDSTVGLERRAAKKILAAGLSGLGGCLAQRGLYDEAFPVFVRSLETAHELGDSNHVLDAYNDLGQCSYLLGSFQQAERYFMQALRLAETMGAPRGIMFNHSLLGDCSLARGDHESALMHYAKALTIATELKDASRISQNLGRLAVVYEQQNRMTEALRMYMSMLAAARESGDRRRIGEAFYYIARSYDKLDSLSLSMDAYRRSMVFAQEFNDSLMIAYSLYGMGRVRQKQGDLDDAMQTYLSSLSYCVPPRGKSLMAAVHNTIGALKMAQLEWKDAMEYLGKSLRISEELNDRRKAAEAMLNIGFLYLYQGR